MALYEELGISRVINANATLTRLGGSVLAPGVAEAMAEAGRAFVSLTDLQRAVGDEIALLTRNEACFVTSGASAGLTLVTAACIAGTDPDLRERLPQTAGLKNEVIIHAHTRVGYDFGIRMAGAVLVEIGGPGGTTAEDLLRAITPRTAAMFFFPRHELARGELPLETAVEICRPRGIAVIVDAAAQLPPRRNLWDYAWRGADAAIFSGGKGLRGPQSSGLILGRRSLVEACAFHAPPNPFIGRGFKVGKEELCGILAAVRWYLAQDEEVQSLFWESVVEGVVRSFRGHKHIVAARDWPNEAGQPVPRAALTLDEAGLGKSRSMILAELLAGDPAIELGEGPPGVVYVNPQTLSEDEVEPLVRRLYQVLAPDS